MNNNILLVGVGGQGTILASKILTMGLLEAGYDVKMSEIHGMSQRGGSVSSQIRYGEKVESPVIAKGGADLLIAFEKMEALRWLEYLKIDGALIVNDLEIPSISVLIGEQNYPNKLETILNEKAKTKIINASKLAEEMGNTKVMNIILLGAIVKSMNLENLNWEKIIKENVKPAFVDLNLKALEKGMSILQ